MKQPYFVVVLAHSMHGRIRRIHIPQHVLYGVCLLALLGLFTLAGVVTSYARMVWKVASYNQLRREAELARERYINLQKEFRKTTQQLAALQLFATEVSTAYGIKRPLEAEPDLAGEATLLPTFEETLEQYNFLKTANISKFHRAYVRSWHVNVVPDLWPVEGRLMGSFGRRSDPFSGEMAFHTGVDISAPVGAAVRATADGIVVHAAWSGGYGRLVVIDHGRGVQTYYAHLSRIDVIAGQDVRRGEIIGAVGGSGRVTAPHLHYEVRIGGSPVNPYKFLARAVLARSAPKDFPF